MANQDRWRRDWDEDRSRDEGSWDEYDRSNWRGDNRSRGQSGDFSRVGSQRDEFSRSGSQRDSDRSSSGSGRGGNWESGSGRDREFGRGNYGSSSGSYRSSGGTYGSSDGGYGSGSVRGHESGYRSGSFGQGNDWDRAYGSGGYTGSRRQDDGRFGSPGGFRGQSGYGAGYRGEERWRSGDDYGRFDQSDRGFFERAADEVSSWFGDEEAERRRRQDHHRGRGPKGYARSDDRIREDISDRLTEDWRVDASDIEIKVASAEVTLTGTVDSRDAKRRAEDIAESVSGVKHVQNNLRVNQTSGSAAWTASSGTSTTGAAGSNLSQTGGKGRESF